VARTRVRIFLREILKAAARRFVPGWTTQIFMKAKLTVRAKRARVNSVFLVQLRKKAVVDFPGLERISRQKRSEIAALDGAVSV
jgi:hypothetical protein